MPRPKTGGRQAGTKNRVTDSMRRDILSVYRKLGGQKFLLSWAQKENSEFVKQCLSRVMPAPPRPALDDDDLRVVDALSDLEVAKRVAFVLARAQAAGIGLQPLVPLERVQVEPEPEPDETPQRYPAPENFREQSLIEETHVEDITSYAGSAAEQRRRPEGVKDPRAAARDALLARHRRLL